MKNSILSLSYAQRRIVVYIYDALIALISYPLAIGIRLESFDITTYHAENVPAIFATFFFLKLSVFTVMGLARGIWRFTSTKDLLLIIKTSTIAVILCAVTLAFWNNLHNIPRSSFIIDLFLTIFFLGGGRFAYRIWRDSRHKSQGPKIVVLGAGVAGEQLIREVQREKSYRIVSILDDDPKKHHRTIHGVKIEGKIDYLPEVIDKKGINQVFIAIPSATSTEIRRMVDLCEGKNVSVKTLPSIKDIVQGRVQISQLRPINIEDLLGRQPVKLDMKSLGKMMTGKKILVTGGGGSIGSELCNQILKFKPEILIIFESCEYNIYKTELTLREKYPQTLIVPIVGDVRDTERVDEVFEMYKPHLVFHAAAYKHVPMMEYNPFEAIKTNVLGTYTVAKTSSAHKVERFVLVSTDKAVNPTNVMGATKRIAEQVCQDLHDSEGNETNFMVVRFGNVLGSAGSVIPRFLDQIKAGGPVTVTHENIRRYFMSIPEATQLIMQAGSLGNGGEIFVLEMGEPVKIVDLAKKLIQLSANRPEDIEVKITGLRPGEKLYEELLTDDENTLPTAHEMVRVACARVVSEKLQETIELFQVPTMAPDKVRQYIHELVPEYTPYQAYNVQAQAKEDEKNGDYIQ